MIDAWTMAGVIAFVVLASAGMIYAAEWLSGYRRRQTAEPDWADLNVVAKPWRRITTDEG